MLHPKLFRLIALRPRPRPRTRPLTPDPAPRLHPRSPTSQTSRAFDESQLRIMPLQKASSATGKRKASATPTPSSSPTASKKPKTAAPSDDRPQAASNGIVDRRFYPPEMARARVARYNGDELVRPVALLEQALADTQSRREQMEVRGAVLHWFKCDLRTRDNRALHLAAERARSKDVPLICVYLISPQDFEAHLTSAARVDFVLRSLAVLRRDLAALDVPLHVETVEERSALPARLWALCERWAVSHLYANAEYEVDELRREARLVRLGLERGVAVQVEPDTCVVSPGELASGTGNQYAVYSPWYRAWVKFLHERPQRLELYAAPGRNPEGTRNRFAAEFEEGMPHAPENKSLTAEERKRLGRLWPAGEHEAQERLASFLDTKAGAYKDRRNFPAGNATAKLSVHFASGTLSARSAISAAREANSSKKLDAGNAGIAGWIGEVAWRDFYKHVLAHWPHVCMNKAFKPEYNEIVWEWDDGHLEAWKQGRTGYPIVDAAMRELKQTAYMHNRCRMITASFLAKDLLLDWRLGEQWFMLNLVDGDFASNNGGWGFSSSAGVDPQPYFRIFNPLLQSERFDGAGEYIRRWVPELKELSDKEIHDPWTRGKGKEVAEKNGYPKPIVEHKMARERALARYKEGLGRQTT